MAYRRRSFSNPDNLKDAAIDSGMALAAGAVTAVGAGLAIYGASKITYAPTVSASDAAMYRTAVVAGGVALLGFGLQFGGPKVAGVGKAMLVAAVALPGAAYVAGKTAEVMAPSVVAGAPAPLTAGSSGMYGYGNSAGMGGMGFSTGYNQGLPPAFAPSQGMGVNSGVSSYYRAA